MMFRHYLKQNRGQAIVETAIVLPVVVLLLFTIIEFGQLLNEYLVVTAAAREGARAAAVSDATAANTAARNAAATINHGSLNVTIAYEGGARVRGDSVTVTVTNPFQTITPLMETFIPPGTVVSGRAIMRVE